MKKLLIADVLPIMLFSCAKEEKTNPLFREPTCADTTDEGKFEAYTMPEATEFLRFHKVIPDTPYSKVVRYQVMSGRVVYNRRVDYNPFIVYRMNKPVKIFGYLPFPNQPEKYYSWVVNAPDTSQDYRMNVYQLREHNPILEPGCYRLYYVVSDMMTDTVYTKGHYDVEVKNL